MEKRKKYARDRVSLNMNKARSGSKRIVRTKDTIEVVRLYVENNAENVSWRRNVLVVVLLTK